MECMIKTSLGHVDSTTSLSSFFPLELKQRLPTQQKSTVVGNAIRCPLRDSELQPVLRRSCSMQILLVLDSLSHAQVGARGHAHRVWQGSPAFLFASKTHVNYVLLRFRPDFDFDRISSFWSPALPLNAKVIGKEWAKRKY